MSSDSSVYTLLGVVIGAVLTFLSQHLLYRQQEMSEMRKKAIDLKNSKCLALWEALSDIYQYLYYTGGYFDHKIDLHNLSEHVKKLNVAIIKAEIFISHNGYIQLIEVRDALNGFIFEIEKSNLFSEKDSINPSFHEKHKFLIYKLEELMNIARDNLRKELQLDRLGVLSEN